MHPLGIALAFLAFGLMSGLGVFIVANTLPLLARGLKANTKMRLISDGYLGNSLALFLNAGLFLLGIGLILAGGYATYTVIYGYP